MTRKKNRFFTLIFSTMFGAGQMYMGFMKLGVSLMSLTATVIFFGSWLNIGPIMYTLPVIWFYSFFDSINKMTMPNEVFEKLEDSYIFQDSIGNQEMKKVYKKYENLIAALLILVGLYSLVVTNLSYWQRYNAGRIIFAVIIIVIGVKLIVGKKKELDKDDKDTAQDTPIELLTLEMHNEAIKEKISNENP